MSKLRNISGFPEWLPEQKLIEDFIIREIETVYQSYGFVPIETPSVELLTTLESKGLDQKELFVLQRRNAEEGSEAELGLHFDLTVPFARYVAQHLNDLVFPFKRYQIQRVWRGERPQKGRAREFYQCDLDIIARDQLPVSCDAEVLSALGEIFLRLNLCDFRIRVNNRRMLLGAYEWLEIDESKRPDVVRVVDKLDKIGADGVRQQLTSDLGITEKAAESIVALTAEKANVENYRSIFDGLGVESELFREGLSELETTFSLLPEDVLSQIEIDFSLARGLDYYTGLIAEVIFPEYREYGSFGGGGRYENLAGGFIKKSLPGVGATFGLTRLMECIVHEGKLEQQARSTSNVLVTVLSEEARPHSNEVARTLRSQGVSTEVFFKSPKLGKQIDYAAKKGIQFVLFLEQDNSPFELRDIRSKEQTSYDTLSGVAEYVLKNPDTKLSLARCLEKG